MLCLQLLCGITIIQGANLEHISEEFAQKLDKLWIQTVAPEEIQKKETKLLKEDLKFIENQLRKTADYFETISKRIQNTKDNNDCTNGRTEEITNDTQSSTCMEDLKVELLRQYDFYTSEAPSVLYKQFKRVKKFIRSNASHTEPLSPEQTRISNEIELHIQTNESSFKNRLFKWDPLESDFEYKPRVDIFNPDCLLYRVMEQIYYDLVHFVNLTYSFEKIIDSDSARETQRESFIGCNLGYETQSALNYIGKQLKVDLEMKSIQLKAEIFPAMKYFFDNLSESLGHFMIVIKQIDAKILQFYGLTADQDQANENTPLPQSEFQEPKLPNKPQGDNQSSVGGYQPKDIILEFMNHHEMYNIKCLAFIDTILIVIEISPTLKTKLKDELKKHLLSFREVIIREYNYEDISLLRRLDGHLPQDLFSKRKKSKKRDDTSKRK